MFSFARYRPPTPSYRKASESQRKLLQYLRGSTDTTDLFLKTAITNAKHTAALWAVAKGNSTSSYSGRCFGKAQCALFQRLLTQLSKAPGGKDLEESLAKDVAELGTSVQGWRLEKVIEERRSVDSSNQSDITASSAGQVMVS
jgi:hypothetical protein